MLGILSDAHGNGAAFDHGIRLLQRYGAEELYFLGDAVGYVPSDSVLRSILSLGKRIQCTRGNHEEMLLREGSEHEDESAYQLALTRQTLGPQHLTMISNWPDRIERVRNRSRLLLLHGSPVDPTSGYVYPDTDLDSFNSGHDWVFMGNTHRPFIRSHSGCTYVNVGSCGLPRDDGRFGSVALFDPVKQSVRVLRFDITSYTNDLIGDHPSLHFSVLRLFERTDPFLFGDMT